MSEVELLLLDSSENCTLYTIQFVNENKNEFEKFVSTFRENSEYSKDYLIIAAFIKQIIERGALERYFRPEGKFNDNLVAIPIYKSKLRLYGLRLSDKILILGNGGIKNTRTYQEDVLLSGYVLTLKRLDKILKQEIANGNVIITKNNIQTDISFEL